MIEKKKIEALTYQRLSNASGTLNAVNNGAGSGGSSAVLNGRYLYAVYCGISLIGDFGANLTEFKASVYYEESGDRIALGDPLRNPYMYFPFPVQPKGGSLTGPSVNYAIQYSTNASIGFTVELGIFHSGTLMPWPFNFQ